MEENRPDDLDKLFKEGLQAPRRKPSQAVWENIEAELDKDNRRIFFVRLRFALSIAAALLVLLGGVELYFHLAARGPVAIATKAQNGSRKTNKPVLPPFVEARREGRRFGLADTQTTMPEEDSRAGVGLQPVAVAPATSWAPPAAIDPAQRVRSAYLPAPKKASSTVTLQRPRRWAVTGFYSSEFAGYNLTDRDSIATNGKEIDKKEKHVLSSSAMVLVNYTISQHWVIQMGLGYSWAKSHASPTTSYAVNNNGEIKYQVNTLSGYGYVPATTSSAPAQVGDSVLIEHSTTTLHYLNAPVMLSYVLHFKRLTLMPGMGFSLNFLTGATLETKLHSASYSQQDYVVKMYGLKRLNYGVLLKAELGYAIDPHWSIDMVASFKNALTPINLHTVVATYPYNLGVGAGIRYSF